MIEKKNIEEYHQQEEKELYEVSDRIGKSEEYIRQRIMKIIDGREPQEIGLLTKPERKKSSNNKEKMKAFRFVKLKEQQEFPEV
jgi:hypothetical protein